MSSTLYIYKKIVKTPLLPFPATPQSRFFYYNDYYKNNTRIVLLKYKKL